MDTDFSAADCFGDYYDDNDGDGLGDQCEWALARRFAPIMIFDSDDDVGREPYWVARPSSDSSVVIAYLPAYYVDEGCSSIPLCGDLDSGHLGDSEAIGITVKWDTHSQHWIVVHVDLSEHDGYDTHTNGAGQYATGLEYPTETGGPFLVHVAYLKHANYATRSTCNGGGTFGSDVCNNSLSSGDTLYVETDRNLGSDSYRFKDCVYSEVGQELDDYQECFWTGSDFAGWQGENGATASPYSDRLSDFGFLPQ
jgi:hypothetical protein